jgi:hypothetical protein
VRVAVLLPALSLILLGVGAFLFACTSIAKFLGGHRLDTPTIYLTLLYGGLGPFVARGGVDLLRLRRSDRCRRAALCSGLLILGACCIGPVVAIWVRRVLSRPEVVAAFRR